MEFLVGSNSTEEQLVVIHILEGSNKGRDCAANVGQWIVVIGKTNA